MKKLLNQLFLLTFGVLLFASCKKDENKNYFQGGTAPVLTASSTADLVLIRPNATLDAITFSWTNPNYQFTTGLSSHDVFYFIQIDTTGSNFTNPAIQEIPVPNELSKTLTVKELNTALGKLGLLEDITHNVEFRLKSTLINKTAVLYSDVIKIVITPYLDVAVPVPPTGELYITGNACASDWTNNPPTNQQCDRISLTEYTITYTFSPGKFYKFLSNRGQWQPQYGASNLAGATYTSAGGDFSANMGGGNDPDAFPTPAIAGNYKITLNYKNGKFSVVKL